MKSDTLGNSVHLGRFFGIEVRLHYSWLIIFVIVTWSLADYYFPRAHSSWPTWEYWLIGIVSSLLFFGSVLAHELAHSLVARAQGVPVRDITLFIFGGASRITQEPRRPLDEAGMAIVGPATSIALGVIFGFLWWLSRHSTSPFSIVTAWLSVTNISLGIFNLIPGFPLDGGRVLRALVWAKTRNMRQATRIAALVSTVVAYLLILWGLWQLFGGNAVNGIWTAFIGWFLESAAAQAYQQVRVQEALKGHQAREVMEAVPTIPSTLTLDTLVDQTVLPSGRRCFPVVDNGRLVGLLTLHRIRTIPRERWPATQVADVMIPQAQLHTLKPDDDLADVFTRMTDEDVNQFPVIDEHGRYLGMVGRDRLLNFLRTRADMGLVGI